jgi:hypothetical protein
VKTALLVAVALAAPPNAAVVIRGGGLEFTTADVRNRQIELRAKGQPFTPDQLVDGLTSELTLAAEARRTGLAETDADARATVGFARRKFLASLYVARIAKIPKPTEADALAAFHLREDTARLQSVVVATREEAAALRSRVEKGADIAKEALASLDPNGAARRGDTGVMPRIVMDEPLAAAVFSSPKGALVGPIQSGNGWIVAKVMETTVGTAAQFAASRERVEAFLVTRLEEQARAHAIEMLRKDARVTIDTEALPLLPEKGSPSPATADRVLLTVRDRSFTVREVLPALRGLQRGGHGGSASLRMGVDEFASMELLATAVTARGLDREPETAAALVRNDVHALAEWMGRRILSEVAAKGSEKSRGDDFLKRLEAMQKANKVWVDRPAALAALGPST